MKHPQRPRLAALTVLSLFALAPDGAVAQFDGRTADDVVRVSLIEGWRLPDGNHMAALRIDLAPGWKTYWRAPGEGGVPTELRLSQVDGIRGMAIHWPSPEVFFSNGIRSIGYHDGVILPVEFTLDGAGPVEIRGRVEMGVCLDICVPVSINLAGRLPDGGSQVPAIVTALSDRALTASEAGAGHATCAIEPISDGLRVTVSALLPSVGNNETVVVEHRDPMIWVSDAQTRRQGAMVTGVVDVVPADHGPFALTRSDLRITVIGTGMAVELDDCTG